MSNKNLYYVDCVKNTSQFLFTTIPNITFDDCKHRATVAKSPLFGMQNLVYDKRIDNAIGTCLFGNDKMKSILNRINPESIRSDGCTLINNKYQSGRSPVTALYYTFTDSKSMGQITNFSTGTTTANAVIDKAAADKAAADKAAADKAAALSAAADKAAADKAAIEKAVLDKIAADKAAADKAAIEKAVLDKIAADKAAADKISSSFKYIGCYKDSPNKIEKIMQDKDITTTIKTCNDLAKIAGSKYFGIQNWEKGDFASCSFGDQKLTLDNIKKIGISSDCIISNNNYYGKTPANAIYETKFDEIYHKNLQINESSPKKTPENEKLFEIDCVKKPNSILCTLHLK